MWLNYLHSQYSNGYICGELSKLIVFRSKVPETFSLKGLQGRHWFAAGDYSQKNWG